MRTTVAEPVDMSILCRRLTVMPESKGRKPAPKKTPAQKRAAKKAAPRKAVVPPPGDEAFQVPAWSPRADDPRNLDFKPPNRSPIRELTEDEQIELPALPEPASYDEVLVALSQMDPLEQEVLIAQRLLAMPSQKDGGMPVPIPRFVRPPWAVQLRKLGLFCIPELATHELVADSSGGLMANHTPARLQKLSTDDFWDMAKQQNPALGKMIDEADTPEKKKVAMAQLAKSMPVEMRIAFDRLMSSDPEDLTPR